MKPKLYDEHGNSIKHNILSPSNKFIDKSSILTAEARMKIIDLAAKYVGENVYGALGRPLMCLQFAILVKHMLKKEGINSRVEGGQAKYSSDTENFEWQHYWIKTEDEIIDCNIDSVNYVEECPDSISPYNYWGSESDLPTDRTFANVKNFTEADIVELERCDAETVVWKNKIDNSY